MRTIRRLIRALARRSRPIHREYHLHVNVAAAAVTATDAVDALDAISERYDDEGSD